MGMGIDTSSADHDESPAAPDRRGSGLLKRSLFLGVAVIGGIAAGIALTRSEEDPIELVLDSWPMVFAAAVLYALGMAGYALSWAALFPRFEDRRLLSLGFLVSQPMKYLPSGIAQPVGQVVLAAQAIGSKRAAAVAFPVHVLINVEAAITLGTPLLFLVDVPGWAKWLVLVVPFFWAALHRSWMAALLKRLGRLHRVFNVATELPDQPLITRAFLLALLSHGFMFASFAVFASGGLSEWSIIHLGVAYALAWLVGYVALPAPAGIGAREGTLVVLLGQAATTVNVIRISAAHRVVTLIIELLLLVVALAMTQGALFPKRS